MDKDDFVYDVQFSEAMDRLLVQKERATFVYPFEVYIKPYINIDPKQQLINRQYAQQNIPQQEAINRTAFIQLPEAENSVFSKEPIQELIDNMVTVEGGTFEMGCDDTRDGDCNDDEKPVHSVSLSSYQISKYEVTQEQWEAVMGKNPSYNKNCPKCPVENVSWDDVQAFLEKLNAMTGMSFRLPTEAEWEYAARGGNKSKGYKYAGSNDLSKVANYCDKNCGYNWKDEKVDDGYANTAPVGSYQPNELGLYDMSGNVWEWCQDGYDENYYANSPKNNPSGAKDGFIYRVLRGGSWYLSAGNCRAADRTGDYPDYRINFIGFRPACLQFRDGQ